MNTHQHLLSQLGVLSAFGIARKISKERIDKISNNLKKVYKTKNKSQFQKLLTDALIADTKKSMEKESPPGLFPSEPDTKPHSKDRYYAELSVISKTLADKFQEQKLTKQQICFIINAIVNLTGLEESDFEEFHRKFSKYKEEKGVDDGSDDDDDS